MLCYIHGGCADADVSAAYCITSLVMVDGCGIGQRYVHYGMVVCSACVC